MKKLLLSLACVFGMTAMNAETVTLTFGPGGDIAKLTETEEGSAVYQGGAKGITLTAAKNNGSTAPTINENGADLRVYAKGTLTISAANPITAITFEISAQGKKRLAEITPSTGLFEEQGEGVYTLNWEGNAASVDFTVGDKSLYGTEGAGKAGQFDVSSITVTTSDEEGFVAAPVFTPARGPIMPGTQVEISCATEGATIYYTTDETDPTNESTVYAGPITVNDYMVIKAIAYTDALHFSEVSEAAFEMVPTLSELVIAYDLDNNTPFVMACEPVVVYQNGRYTYVTDGQDYALIYAADVNLEAGDVVKAGWTGKVSIYNNLVELVPDNAAALEANGTQDVPEPMSVDASMANMMLQAYNQNRHLNLENVAVATVTEGEGEAATTTVTYTMGEGEDAVEVVMYNRFGLEMPTEGNYDVEGFVSVYKEAVQFYPIAFNEPTETRDELYVVGDFQSWNLANAVQFGFNAETGNFTVEIENALEIKISADATDWNAFDEWALYPAEDLVNGEWVECEFVNGLGKGNITLPWKGDYTITVNGYTGMMKVYTETPDPSGIEAIEADAAAVEYFNLQGIRVANPENGVFIVRQGNKVSKAVIR